MSVWPVDPPDDDWAHEGNSATELELLTREVSRLRAELHETRMALVRERVTVSTLIALAEKLREQVARQETR